MRGQTARAFADARHAGRFGKTGRLDFAIRLKLRGRRIISLRAQVRRHDRTQDLRKIEDGPLISPHRPEIAPPSHSLSESRSTSPNRARITASSNSPVAGLPVRENARAPACSSASARARRSATIGTHDLLSFAGFQVAFLVPIECDDDMIGHRQFQTGFKFSAEDLPVRLSATIS